MYPTFYVDHIFGVVLTTHTKLFAHTEDDLTSGLVNNYRKNKTVPKIRKRFAVVAVTITAARTGTGQQQHPKLD